MDWVMGVSPAPTLGGPQGHSHGRPHNSSSNHHHDQPQHRRGNPHTHQQMKPGDRMVVFGNAQQPACRFVSLGAWVHAPSVRAKPVPVARAEDYTLANFAGLPITELFLPG